MIRCVGASGISVCCCSVTCARDRLHPRATKIHRGLYFRRKLSFRKATTRRENAGPHYWPMHKAWMTYLTSEWLKVSVLEDRMELLHTWEQHWCVLYTVRPTNTPNLQRADFDDSEFGFADLWAQPMIAIANVHHVFISIHINWKIVIVTAWKQPKSQIHF